MNLIHYGKYNEKPTLEDADQTAWEKNVEEAKKRCGHQTEKFHYTRHPGTMTHREAIAVDQGQQMCTSLAFFSLVKDIFSFIYLSFWSSLKMKMWTNR